MADNNSATFPLTNYYDAIKNERPTTQPVTEPRMAYKNKDLKIAGNLPMANLIFSGIGNSWRGATATPYPPGSVYRPDIFWEFSNRKQVGHSLANLYP